MKKASPAQLAARKRFAEMARSGAFKKATKRKANPTKSEKTWQRGYGGDQNTISAIIDGAEVLIFPIKKSEIKFYDMPEWTKAIVEVVPDEKHVNIQFPVGSIAEAKDNVKGFVAASKKYKLEELEEKSTSRKTNPATIQYIVLSELSPQKYKQMLVTENKQRAISVANVNQMDGYHSVVEDQVGHLIYDAKTRQGYLQSNPMQKYTVLYRGTANVAGEVIASGPQAAKQKVAEKLGIPTLAYLVAKKTNPAKKTVSQKISQLVHEGYPQRQAVAVALSEQRAGKVKRNPAKVKYRNLATDLKGDQRVGYSVHMADRPSYHAIAWFSKKADAIAVAQEAADRTGKPLAVTRVQNYFGAM